MCCSVILRGTSLIFCGCKVFERQFIPTYFTGIFCIIAMGLFLAGFQKDKLLLVVCFLVHHCFVKFCFVCVIFLIDFNAKCYRNLICFLSYFNVFLFYYTIF